MGEETAVNKYNMAALLAEKSAAVGITTEENREVEQLFEDVVRIWTQQEDNGSIRCIMRSNIRRINYHLKTTRTKFPDLRYVMNDKSQDEFLMKLLFCVVRICVVIVTDYIILHCIALHYITLHYYGKPNSH